MSNISSKLSAVKAEKGKKRALTTEHISWVTQEEVDNFLKIFTSLINIKENQEEEAEEEKDSEDGMADVILFAVRRLSELLKSDIDSLKFPKPIKKTLKILKGFIDFINAKKVLESFQNASNKSNA